MESEINFLTLEFIKKLSFFLKTEKFTIECNPGRNRVASCELSSIKLFEEEGMSHELSLVQDGKAEMFYYGETPWHGLGTRVDGALTAFEAIKAAHLDWEVQKRRLYYYPFMDFFSSEDLVDAPAFATVRQDNGTFLGIVSSGYQVIQNHEAFSFFDSVVGSAEAKYHTAGALNGGKKVWMLAKLPEPMRIKGDDIVDKYLLLINSHDGRMRLRVMFTPIRVVCQNTLNTAINSAIGKGVAIRHTGNVMKKVEEARRVLGIANEKFTEAEQIFKAFANKSLSTGQVNDYINSVAKILYERDSFRKKFVDAVYILHEEGAGSDMARGTLWGAYNAVVEYVDHWKEKEFDNSYLSNILFGVGAGIKNIAMATALEFVR